VGEPGIGTVIEGTVNVSVSVFVGNGLGSPNEIDRGGREKRLIEAVV